MSMFYSDPNDMWRHNDYDPYKGMDDDERIAAGICHAVMMVLAFCVAMAICAMCSSCTTVKYVPVIEHKTDTLIQTKYQHDSLYFCDSVYVIEKHEGDTVFMTKYKQQTRYIYKAVHDTTYVSKTDSVQVPVPVTEYVERELTWWQKTLMYLGGMLIVIFVIWVWRTK